MTCDRPHTDYNPVTGNKVEKFASVERNTSYGCGPGGIYFEPLPFVEYRSDIMLFGHYRVSNIENIKSVQQPNDLMKFNEEVLSTVNRLLKPFCFVVWPKRTETIGESK